MKYFTHHFTLSAEVAKDLQEEVERNAQLFQSIKFPYFQAAIGKIDRIQLRGYDQSDEVGAKAEESLYQPDAKKVHDLDPPCIDYPALALFPTIDAVAYQIAERLGYTDIGKLIINNLLAGEVVKPHIDGGKYFETRDRFHLVLKTNPDALFFCGPPEDREVLHMKLGEVWSFRNDIVHWVENRGQEDRYHLLFDMR